MPFSSRSVTIAVVLVVVLLKPVRPVRAETVDEQLFLLYALEDMYRSTRPGWKRDIKTSHTVKRFLAVRRVMADRLRRQIETRKQDEVLARCYKDYVSLLDTIEPFIENIEKKEDDYYSYFRNLRQRLRLVDRRGRAETSLRTLHSASSAMSASLCNPFHDVIDTLGTGLFSGLSAYAMASMRHQLRMTKAIESASDEAKQHKRENWARLQKDIGGIAGTFFERFDQDQATHVAKAARELRELQEKYGWAASEAEFNPHREPKEWSADEQPRNPFRIKARALLVLDQPSEDVNPQELLQLARALRESIRYIPSEKSPTYHRYQAEVYYLVGRLANRAAQIELGQTGFKDARRKPPEAATFAQQAWKSYMALEKRDAEEHADVLHERLLAFAYGGKLDKAFALLQQTSLQQMPSSNPLFWFDVARLLSLRGDQIQQSCDKNPIQKKNPQVRALLAKCKSETMYCLAMALYAGLQKRHDVETNADLQWIRFVGGSDIKLLLEEVEKEL